MWPICYAEDGIAFNDSPPPAAVLPGSFNPLHHGHRALAAAAGHRLGVEVEFELSLANVDKTDLSDDEVARRVGQFAGYAAVWVTRAATFVEKADLFPGVAFVLGWDTAVRLIDPRYYGHDPAGRDAALRKLVESGCRVLVGGRVDAAGTFREWDGDGVPAEFGGLFEVIPAEDFRADVSSTELRRIT